MKVLVLKPDLKRGGGIQVYYEKIKNRFNISIDYFVIGTRSHEKRIYSIIRRIIIDYRQFLKILKKEQYEVVLANPSLDPKGFFRDGLFLLIARLKKRKTIVFFRGWVKSFELSISRYWLWLFKFFYGKIDAFIVLSSEFKKVLEIWGCNQPIYHEVTIADDDAIKEFDVHTALKQRQEAKRWRILFISRLSRDKGIYETIAAITALKMKYPQIELFIAGAGIELNNLKSLVHGHSLSNVVFTGYVTGEKKTKLMKSAHILCLPTFHGEGLPNAITESMSFGLPIITRKVGGINDFFVNGEHGFATKSKNQEVFAGFIERLLTDKELYRKISLYNYQYARSNFLASDAAMRLEKICKSVIKN